MRARWVPLLLAATAWAGDMRVLTFAPPEAKEGYGLKLLALAPVSSTRFLAAFNESVYRWDKWADEEAIKREAQEKGVVSSVNLIKVQDGVFLAFLGKEGRILQRSTLGPDVEYGAASFHEGAWAVLVMEEAERCPYGLLRPDLGELWCYDWQLSLKARRRVPLAA